MNAFFTGDTQGGAIVNNSGSFSVDRSVFEGNRAVAGGGARGGSGLYFVDGAYGGALMNAGGTMTVSNSRIVGNLAQGGSRATAGPDLGFIGDANGGGFAGFGAAVFTDSTFDDNTAVSGRDNVGSRAGVDASAAYGGAIAIDGGALLGLVSTFSGSNLTMTHNRAIGGDGNRAGGNPAGVLVGTATGGAFALFDGGSCSLTISDSTIDRNQAIGGANEAGGDGADGRGGGLATHFGGVLIVSASTVDDNLAVGGEGGFSGLEGNGLGGGLYNDTGSMTSLTGDRVEYNIAVGAFGFGGLGQGVGGGTYDLGAITIDPTTVVKRNHASTSHPNTFP